MSKMIKCRYMHPLAQGFGVSIIVQRAPNITDASRYIELRLRHDHDYEFNSFIYNQIKDIEGLTIMEQEHCKNCKCAPEFKQEKVDIFDIGEYLNDIINYLYNIARLKDKHDDDFFCTDLPEDWWLLPAPGDKYKEWVEYRLSHLDMPSCKIMYCNGYTAKYYVSWDKKISKIQCTVIPNDKKESNSEVSVKAMWRLVSYMNFQVMKAIYN